jgi:hypothetical protein
MSKIDKNFEQLKSEQQVFLSYLRAKFPVFHNSNFFFRDLHYGVKGYFEKKGKKISYSDSQQIAEEYAKLLEEQGIFVKTSDKTWKVEFPEFVTTEPGDPL